MTDLQKKWSHLTSPIAKRKQQLEEKLANGKITDNGIIELNNIAIEYLKDVIKIHKYELHAINLCLDQIMQLKKQNENIQEQITLKNKKKIVQKPRVFHLRKGPKK